MSKTSENKCLLCGLKVTFSQKGSQENNNVEDLFEKVRKLQRNKIVPKGWLEARHINLQLGVANPGNSSQVCAINHASWWQNDKKCKYWQPSIGLSLGEYLALHEARKMETLTVDIHKLTAIAVLIPIGYLILELFKWAKTI
jgi:hypothetical protein